MVPLELQEQLRLITETISEVFWMASPDLSKMYYVSPAYERIWGRSVESLFGNPMSFLDSVHPDDRARVSPDLTRQRASGAFDHEYRITHTDGSTRWIWDRGFPIVNGTDNVQYYVGVATDITERKLAQANAAGLADRFQLMSRATNDGIWDWDIVANTAWWGDALYDSFGYDRATVPTFEAWVERVHPEDRERVIAGFTRALGQGAATWSHEYRFVMPDGSVREIFDRAHVLHDAQGKPIRMLGAMVDLTPVRSLEAQLRQAQKMEAIGQLAGGIAHDFNNIIQAIILELQLVKAIPDLPAKATKHVRDIRAAADRAAALTRQLLVFSRREQPRLRSIDINVMLVELVRMLHRIVGEDVALHLDLSPGTVVITADPGMLDQVLVNLAINARDAMPRGGDLGISTSVVEHAGTRDRPPGRYACIAVRDSGSGIARDIVPRIFEPFFTTKEPGRGTGLGLATAFGIIEQHGGWIDVDSEVGQGATFRTYLPLSTNEEPQHLTAPETASAAGGTERILVVEDDASVRRAVRSVLEEHGYQVVDADRGAEALRIFDSGDAIDLLLTDLVMPGGMDGWQLAAQLEATQPGLKTVFVTGYSRDVERHALARHQALLHKPITADGLLNAIRECLDS